MFSSAKLIEFQCYVHSNSKDRFNANSLVDSEVKQLNPSALEKSKSEQLLNQGSSPIQTEGDDGIPQNINTKTEKLQSEPKNDIKQTHQSENPNYDPYTANSLERSAEKKMENFEIAEAFTEFNQVLEIRRKGNAPPLDIAKSLNDVGSFLLIFDKLDEATEHLLGALELRRKHLRDPHDDIGNTLNNIGNAMSIRKDHQKAYQYHLEALQMRKKLFPINSKKVSDSSVSVGYQLQLLNKNQEALSYFLESIPLVEEHVKSLGHSEIDLEYLASLYKNTGLSFQKLNDHQKALLYLTNSLNIKIKLYGDDHSEVKQLQSRIKQSLSALQGSS